MIYLASPYSDPDPAVEEERFQAVCKQAAEMIRAGKLVFSPIAHSHPISKYGLPGDAVFWEAYNRAWMERCESLSVLMLPGWLESVGVRGEVVMAESASKRVEYLHPTTKP